MFEAARRHLRSIAMIGVASALTVGGVAVAQGGGEGDVEPASRPAVMGIGMSSLAYAELRARPGNGDQTIRINPGRVESADDASMLPKKGDVVRAIRGSQLPPPPGPALRFPMAAPR